jgi:hypothetical protein
MRVYLYPTKALLENIKPLYVIEGMIMYMQNKKSKSLLEVTFTIKEIVVFSLFLLVFTGLLTSLYVQNTQIQQLTSTLESLQRNHDSLFKSIEQLRNTLITKEVELSELRDVIKTIKVALGIVGTITFVGLGFWLFKGTTALFSLKAWIPTSVLGFTQKLGFFNDSEKYYKLHQGNNWLVEVINKGGRYQSNIKNPWWRSIRGRYGHGSRLGEQEYHRPHIKPSDLCTSNQYSFRHSHQSCSIRSCKFK